MIECNASKDFVNDLICDWFCLVFFYGTGLFSSVHKVNAGACVFIAKKLKKFEKKNAGGMHVYGVAGIMRGL